MKKSKKVTLSTVRAVNQKSVPKRWALKINFVVLFHHVKSKQSYLLSHGCYMGFFESLGFWLLGTLVNFPLIKSRHHRNAWFGPLLSRLTGQNFINVALKLKKLWPFENRTSITVKFWYSCINSLQQPHTALQTSE